MRIVPTCPVVPPCFTTECHPVVLCQAVPLPGSPPPSSPLASVDVDALRGTVFPFSADFSRFRKGAGLREGGGALV